MSKGLPYTYQLSGLLIESNLPFPELVDGNGRTADCTFQLLPVGEPSASPLQWVHRAFLSDGSPWLQLAKQGCDYFLRFPDLADFRLSSDGNRVRCHPKSDTPAETIRHLFLDSVLPRALSLRGCRVLHAGAVVAPEGAVAFIGDSGCGKSTLTAGFVTAGFPFLTDDVLLLKEHDGRLDGSPSYPGLRLWPDAVVALFEPGEECSPVAHYTDKRRLRIGRGRFDCCAKPVPVQKIYVLTQARPDADTVSITPLSPREALMALIEHAYRLDPRDRERLSKEFAEFSRIATFPALVSRLAFPRGWSWLPRVRERVLQDLARTRPCEAGTR